MIGILFLAAIASPGQIKPNDWTVGCDNGRACHASSLMPPASPDQWMTMTVKRGPEPNARPLIAIVTRLKPARMRRERGGPFIRLVPRIRGAREQALGLFPRKYDYQVDSRDLQAVIAVLRSDGKMVVEDAQGRKLGEISFVGASAALLYIDDIQRRVGTVTALVRRGPKPAATIPAPPSLPVVRSAARNVPLPFRISATRIAALRKSVGGECNFGKPGDPGFGETQAALDGNRVLLLIGCDGGAYNTFHFVFVATRRGGQISIRDARFVTSEGTSTMLTRATWNAQQGLLSSSMLGRYMGDCGEITHYVWDGRQFRRAEQREMSVGCRGAMDYITTWRARIVPN